MLKPSVALNRIEQVHGEAQNRLYCSSALSYLQVHPNIVQILTLSNLCCAKIEFVCVQAGMPEEAASCLYRAQEFGHAGQIYTQIKQLARAQECLDAVSTLTK